MTVLPIIPVLPDSVEVLGQGGATPGEALIIELGTHTEWTPIWSTTDERWYKFTAPACDHDYPQVAFGLSYGPGCYLYTGHPAATTTAELTEYPTYIYNGSILTLIPGETYYIQLIYAGAAGHPRIFTRSPSWGMVQLSLYPQVTNWVQGNPQTITGAPMGGTNRAAQPVDDPVWDATVDRNPPPGWNTINWQGAAVNDALTAAPSFIGTHQMYRGFGGHPPWADRDAYACIWRNIWRQNFDGFQWWTDDLGVEHGGGEEKCAIISSNQFFQASHAHAFWWIDCDPGRGFGISDNVEGFAYAPALRVSLNSILWGLGPQGGYSIADASAFIASQGRDWFDVQQQFPDDVEADMCELNELHVSFDEYPRPANTGTVHWYATVSQHTNSTDLNADVARLSPGIYANRVTHVEPQQTAWITNGATSSPAGVASAGTLVGDYSGGASAWYRVSDATVTGALAEEMRALVVWDPSIANHDYDEYNKRAYLTGLTLFGYLDECFFDAPPPQVAPTADDSYWEGGRQDLWAHLRVVVTPKPFRFILNVALAPLDVEVPQLISSTGELRDTRRTFGRPATT